MFAALSFGRFPLDDLDLTPFLSSSVLRKRYGLRKGGQSTNSNSIGSESNGEEDADGRPPAEYRLYAVVCHHGQMEGGHYVAYIRQALARHCERGLLLEGHRCHVLGVRAAVFAADDGTLSVVLAGSR
jgi:hypothetical protein